MTGDRRWIVFRPEAADPAEYARGTLWVEIGAVRGVTELEAQQKAEDHYGRNVVVQPWPETPEEMR